jgi:hypothetical protein
MHFSKSREFWSISMKIVKVVDVVDSMWENGGESKILRYGFIDKGGIY